MRRSPLIGLAVSVVLCASMWLYVSRVLVPQQRGYAASRGIPRGNLSDLYPRWLGSRELLLLRRDPYSAEVTREIQSGYYGRPLDRARPNDPHDQQAFAYPVYVAFLLAPTIQLPFAVVQEGFRWLLAGLAILSVVLWLRIGRWQQSWTTAAMWILLTLGSFPAVQGIRLQQLSLLVAALIAGCIYLLVGNDQISAGILLALATIKPQLALPVAAWLMLWSLSRLSLRWKFAASFVLTLAALIAGGEILLPGWIHSFYTAVMAYRQYAGSASVVDQLLPVALSLPLTALMVIATARVGWRARNNGALSEDFCGTTSLVLALTVILVPTVAPYNQLLLLPGAFLVVRNWNKFLRVNVVMRVLRALAAACVIWSWVSATTLTLASFFTQAALRYWQIPLWTSLLVPIPLAACLGLYATGHGIQPPRETASN